MPPRRYVSPVRAAAADQKRAQVLAAAAGLLREAAIADFSMDAVAKAAGVTRLTVYRQFGSRRALLEAVFDDCAEAGGLHRIPQAMALPDARAGLDRLIAIFCAFWTSDAAIGRLHDAMATDPELAQALGERNERRRQALAALLGRIAPHADQSARADTVDLLFAMTSQPMFVMLGVGRAPDETCALVQTACAALIEKVCAVGLP